MNFLLCGGRSKKLDPSGMAQVPTSLMSHIFKGLAAVPPLPLCFWPPCFFSMFMDIITACYWFPDSSLDVTILQNQANFIHWGFYGLWQTQPKKSFHLLPGYSAPSQNTVSFSRSFFGAYLFSQQPETRPFRCSLILTFARV